MTVKRSVGRGLTEFIAVVLGVAVALAGENWLEGMNGRELEGHYLGRLEAELREGQPSVRGTFDRVQASVAAIDTLLTLEEGGSSLSRVDSLRLVTKAANYGFNAEGVIFDQTYQEMLATGSLSLIRDHDLRAAITGYYRDADRLVGVLAAAGESGLREWTVLVKAASGRAIGGLRRDGADLDSATEERLLSLLRTDGAAWNQLRTTRGSLETVRGFLNRLGEGTEELLAAFP